MFLSMGYTILKTRNCFQTRQCLVQPSSKLLLLTSSYHFPFGHLSSAQCCLHTIIQTRIMDFIQQDRRNANARRLRREAHRRDRVSIVVPSALHLGRSWELRRKAQALAGFSPPKIFPVAPITNEANQLVRRSWADFASSRCFSGTPSSHSISTKSRESTRQRSPGN